MAAKSNWPEIVFASEHAPGSLTRAVDRGTLIRLARGIYSGRVQEDPAQIVERNRFALVAHEFPGAVIADRSAYLGGRSDNEDLYVVHTRRRSVPMPGLRIVPRSGPGPQRGDMPFVEGLWISSRARTLLDSIALRPPRGLSADEVEQWLDHLLSVDGEPRVNVLRDEARALAEVLGRVRAFARLDELISAALMTGPAHALRTPILVARADGRAYDATREERFALFVEVLSRVAPSPLSVLAEDAERRALLPFYEAYFSNYIEGTEFTLDEAAEIVFDGAIPAARPRDAHDVLGTYEIVSDDHEMSTTPRDAGELLELLRRRHATLMSARPDALPGRFKERANRVGATEFVQPDLVAGTLSTGFELGKAILDPFQRAAYVMFLVTEVHPFTDGNGRIARIMMNAELHAASQVRVIVPTVFRLNYLAALRGATHNAAFEPLIAVLAFAQKYTARIDFSRRERAEHELEATNAFREPYEAERAGIRLVLPS